MREFELVIDEAFKNGLSPEAIVPTNSQLLLECLGFRCGKGGLEVHKELTNPIPVTVDMYYNWPFPQFITGEKYNFLIVRDLVTNQWDSVYLVSSDHTTITHIFDIDELTFGKGTLMEVADFGEYVIMTNGVIIIYWNVVLNVWSQMVVSATIPLMRTMCNFKGQAVGGNVVSAWHDCDETFYVWSKIGSIDFTPDQDNEAGYRRCPFGGVVYHVRRLGDSIIGYSSKGIVQLDPVADPTTTFRFKELHDVGLINRGAMNGNLREQVFVDNNYNVWKIGIGVDVGGLNIATINPKMLGYRQYMQQLIGEDIIVSYDPSKGDFYIGNSTKTFLLTPNGLTEVKQHPSAVWRSDNESYMIPDVVDGDESYLCTESFDMAYKGQKTVFSIETDAMHIVGAEAGIDWAHDLTNWNLDFYKPINNQGIASIVISGNAFRFKLKFTTVFEDTRISYLKTRYKMTDLRGIKGVYAPPLRGQSK
jgi:hypothetical protein